MTANLEEKLKEAAEIVVGRGWTLKKNGAGPVFLLHAAGTLGTAVARRMSKIVAGTSLDDAACGESMQIWKEAGMEGVWPWRLELGVFRAPHHTASVWGMVGVQGPKGEARPGELALAHGGLLLLDEAPEFRRDVLEAIRDGWRRGNTQGKGKEWPCRFELVLSGLRCPCGWRGTSRECVCLDAQVDRYLGRVMGVFPRAEIVVVEELLAGIEIE